MSALSIALLCFGCFSVGTMFGIIFGGILAGGAQLDR